MNKKSYIFTRYIQAAVHVWDRLLYLLLFDIRADHPIELLSEVFFLCDQVTLTSLACKHFSWHIQAVKQKGLQVMLAAILLISLVCRWDSSEDCHWILFVDYL